MKKYLFLLLTFFISNIAFASFPVGESAINTNHVIQSEIVDNNTSTVTTNLSRDGAGWGIASLACGFVGLFVGSLILGPLAIIFGALGLKKRLKGLAIAGMILGLIELLVIVLLVGLILAAV